MKFCDIPVGSQFRYQGEVYVKTAPLVARNEASGEQKFFRRASMVQSRSDSILSGPVDAQKQFPYTRIHQAMDEFCEEFRRDISDLETIQPIDIEKILARGRGDFLRKFK
jgi:hypothetical protein